MTGVIGRVVVALDAASESRAAIGTAARLAARWRAHLHGVFVEDDDLLRLANLPFARQVTLGLGAEPLNRQQAERQMRVFAERARQDLAASAKRHGVEWTFEIMRGAPPDGFAADDFLVACTATRPIGGHFRVECRWWSATTTGPSMRLLAQGDGDPHGAVAALIHGRGAPSERLLDAAIRLAEANGSRLAIICAPSLAQAAGFKDWLEQRVAGHGVEVVLELLPEPARLHRRIADLHCRLVVVEASAEEAQPDQLRDLVTKIACDVMVVR